MMESPLPDYKVGDNVVVELPTRTIEGKVGYVGETDVRIDTSAQGQSWDNEVINKQQFEEGLRQNEPNATRPVRTEKTVAVYPAKENNLPFDIVIQTISTESPTVEAEHSAPEPAGNFHITNDHLGEGGAKQKYARNIEAIILQSTLRRCASFAWKYGKNGSGHQRAVPACGGASLGRWLEAQRHDPAQWSHHPAGQYE